MEAATASRLHPALLVAALSVTAFSLAGIGVLTGLIPWQGTAPVAAVVPSPPAVPLPAPEAEAPSPVVEPPAAVALPAEAARPAVKPAVVRTAAQEAPARAPTAAEKLPRRSEQLREPVAVQPVAPLPAPPVSNAPVVGEVWPSAPPPQPLAIAQPLPPPPAVCRECGWIESVQTVEQPGDASGLGAVAGGVLGGAVGSQVGKGRGNQLATIAGVVGGAYVGHQIEKSQRKRVSYEITVRMEDGSAALVRSDTPPAQAIGERVRVVNGRLLAER